MAKKAFRGENQHRQRASPPSGSPSIGGLASSPPLSDDRLEQGSGRGLLSDLFESALLWRLVWAPADKTGTVAETIARHLIEAHFDHEFRLQRDPGGAAF